MHCCNINKSRRGIFLVHLVEYCSFSLNFMTIETVAVVANSAAAATASMIVK